MTSKKIPKRLYDDKRRKRQIFVSITSWRGVSVGAKHFYAKVYEDDNPVLLRGYRISGSDDKDCKGREFGGVMDTSFDTFNSALDWVIEIIKEHFPRTSHKLFDVSGGMITLNQLREALKEKS